MHAKSSWGAAQGRFPSTHWSTIQQVADPGHPDAQQAMEDLLIRYWRPLYAHLRHPRWGFTVDQARDLIQEFLTTIMERPGYLGGADRNRGRFRHYIKGALNHFVLDRLKAERALKRGGGRKKLQLDFDGAESQLGLTDSASRGRSWLISRG